MSGARLPLVAVVGRPNVGKSTLFNRIVPGGDAVVDDQPGVTRDRREGEASWNGVAFRIMDTGGLVPGSRDFMETAIYEQGEAALNEADLVLFLVDARQGLTALDEDIAGYLRPRADKVLLVANKAESSEQELAAAEFAALGFSEAMPVSAQHGQGMGDMLDVLVERLPKMLPEQEQETAVSIAIVGKPNVGKSSIANRLLGATRFIVHDEAGTTRDAVDARFRYDGTEFVLVDTAGLRRRSHVEQGVEYYSTVRTRRSLMRCDVALVVLDASQEIAAQDSRVAGMAMEAGKSVIFIMNKWDLVTKTTGTAEAYERMIRDKFPLMKGCPVLFTSAVSGQRIQRIPELARSLWEERRRRVPTAELNALLKAAVERVHPTVKAGTKPLKLYYMTQTGQEPPTFVIFVNNVRSVVPSYRKYLVNTLRDALGFSATPLRVQFRSRRS